MTKKIIIRFELKYSDNIKYKHTADEKINWNNTP